jgi:peroxiredoxin Q/BCP
MKIPSFKLQSDSGEWRSENDYLGQPLVLYFYPKDHTPGCTKEACTFRDRFPDFEAMGARVVGVSADGIEQHGKFKRDFGLPFELLSDPKGSLSSALGVQKSLFGLLPGRETLVFDAHGELKHRFSSQLNVHKHVEEALRALKSS